LAELDERRPHVLGEAAKEEREGRGPVGPAGELGDHPAEPEPLGDPDEEVLQRVELEDPQSARERARRGADDEGPEHGVDDGRDRHVPYTNPVAWRASASDAAHVPGMLRTEGSGAVVVWTLDNAAKRNALDLAMCKQLVDALAAAPAAGTRAIVL